MNKTLLEAPVGWEWVTTSPETVVVVEEYGISYGMLRRMLPNAPEKWSRWYARVAFPETSDNALNGLAGRENE